MVATTFKNPFRPGAGHLPPYLAGRTQEQSEFTRLLDQETILENLILTGLRGVGKTVLLETFKPIAIESRWLWVGTDMSESASISEHNMATRLLSDLSLITSSFVLSKEVRSGIGFEPEEVESTQTLTYAMLSRIYDATPGLTADKLKTILKYVWTLVQRTDRRGIIFAYDEAQNLADHSAKEQYPLSLLLDVFQSIQKVDIPFMLALTGLPTLFPKLVEARTYSERMFRVLFLDRLSDSDSRDAIEKPIKTAACPVKFHFNSVDTICDISAGYPYFIQFICREVYDIFMQQADAGQDYAVPIDEILRKLDSDFFAGRWARATDRQRELLGVAARLENAEHEFTVAEIVAMSRQVLHKPFGSSHVNQMLVSLSEAGLVYKNRHGKYSFAVPLLNRFILRQLEAD
ncbi:ATP-binding protein [bacterium]|nr:ATP-binding protein [bacterium]